MEQERSYPASRVVLSLVAIVALVGGVIQFAFQVAAWRADPGASGTSVLLSEAAMLLAVPSFAVLALLIVWRAPPGPGSLFGALFLSSYALWGLAIGGWLDAGSPLRVVLATACDWTAHIAAIRFAQLFPRKLGQDELRGLGRSSWGRRFAAAYAALLEPKTFWPMALGVEIVVRIASIPVLYVAHVVGVCALAFGYLYSSYRLGSEDDRQRVFWLMEGAVVFLTVELLFLSVRLLSALEIVRVDPSWWGPWLSALEAWLALLCFALAIFRSGAFDSRLVLRRTTVASLTGFAALVLFITMETAITEALESFFGFESPIGTMVGGVTVALLLRPITQRIDRRLGGDEPESVEGGAAKARST